MVDKFNKYIKFLRNLVWFILFACLCFFLFDKIFVKADVLSDYDVYIGSTRLTTRNYKYVGSSTWDNFSITSTSNDKGLIYYRLNICTDVSVTQYNITNNISSDFPFANLYYYDSNIPCNYYNSSAKGHVGSWYWTYDPSSSSSASSTINYRFLHFSGSISLISLSSQTKAFDINNVGNITLNDSNIVNSQKDTTNAIDDLEKSLTNDDTSGNWDISKDIHEIGDGAVSDIVTMPLTLLNAYMDGMSSTCSPINLGTLYGASITLPCIDISNKLGSNLWGTIDGLMSIFMIYNIAMLILSMYNKLTELEDLDPYEPEHAYSGYKPKHGGGN